VTSARTVPFLSLDFSPMRRKRERLHCSQARLGEMLGVDPSTVARWELGLRCPPAYRLYAIARALGTSVVDLTDVVEGHWEPPQATRTPGKRRGRPRTHEAAPSPQEAEGIQP